jgi:diguanylate cyclase (GGDEF)-like protein
MKDNLSEILVQEYGRASRGEKHVVMIHYYNDFSLKEYKIPPDIKSDEGPDIYLREFDFRAIQLPCEPFLDVIRDVIKRHLDGDISGFIKRCNIYPLHREIIYSYLKDGRAKRNEPVIRTEAYYEKEKITEDIISMIREASLIHPFVLVINHMQIAGRLTLNVLRRLLKEENMTGMSLILAMSDSFSFPIYTARIWEDFNEELDDAGSVLFEGNSGMIPTITENLPSFRGFSEEHIIRLNNLSVFLDTETCGFYLDQLLPLVEDDSFVIDDGMKKMIYGVAFRTFFLDDDLSKANDILYKAGEICRSDGERNGIYYYLASTALIMMYMDHLDDASDIVDACLMDPALTPEWKIIFMLLSAMAAMSAWNKIFYLKADVPVPEELIEGLKKKKFYNHLTYIYIYAFDNDPEYLNRSDGKVSNHLKEAFDIIKMTGNKHLLNLAYEKNIMMASSYGLNNIAIRYFQKSLSDFGEEGGRALGEIWNGIGYNLSALGHYKQAEMSYQCSLAAFCKNRSVEDVSETYYNAAMNYLAEGKWDKAFDSLSVCIRIIRHLRLNRLRVCNISKLYALMSLTETLRGNYFSADQLAMRCERFLSIYLKSDNAAAINKGVYGNFEDEIFLYYLAAAVLSDRRLEYGEAERFYNGAARFLVPAGGNCYYAKRIYYENRLSFLKNTGAGKDLIESLENDYEEYLSDTERRAAIDVGDVVEAVKSCAVPDNANNDIDEFIFNEENRRKSISISRNMEFMQKWQKIMNGEELNSTELVKNAMIRFKGYFSVDHCIYICCDDRGTLDVMYNDTKKEISQGMLREIRKAVRMNQHGLVLSKVSGAISNYSNLLSYFGGDKVCSLVMLPYFKGSMLEEVFITYIEMRSDWFSMVTHYLLDEEDLALFEVLISEVNSAIRRIASAERIRDMNRLLYKSAVTDQLTGVRNRNGLYQFVDEIKRGEREDFRGKYAVMFIDLDRFKPYNDHFGHEAGDLVLKSMADIFVKVLSTWGIVVRYGGDEFILLVHTDDKVVLSDIAEEIYEKIRIADGFRQDLEKLLGRKVDPSEPADITCSIGIATTVMNDREFDVQELINEADKVLYEIKNEQKGTYRFLVR